FRDGAETRGQAVRLSAHQPCPTRHLRDQSQLEAAWREEGVGLVEADGPHPANPNTGALVQEDGADVRGRWAKGDAVSAEAAQGLRLLKLRTVLEHSDESGRVLWKGGRGCAV